MKKTTAKGWPWKAGHSLAIALVITTTTTKKTQTCCNKRRQEIYERFAKYYGRCQNINSHSFFSLLKPKQSLTFFLSKFWLDEKKVFSYIPHIYDYWVWKWTSLSHCGYRILCVCVFHIIVLNNLTRSRAGKIEKI